uniref:integrin alpha-1-like n=1 Tax=Styela clava TaxID=7725 RepID=UPI00193A2ACA|nr:integrin alpha-1-like [Styela clava]XP_039273075.1 integrin alpha-1-like [Styela clava]
MLRCEMDKLEATWSDKMPCCSKPCPPHGNMDLVFAVDSSIETEENWEKIKELLKDLITTFLVGPRESRIGIVTYNEKVGADSEIFLNSYNSTTQLASAVNTLRSHPGPTRGTRIGQLLDHVNRVSFLKSNGNRRRYRDILVMLTTGAPLKEKLDPKTTAKLLRDNGIDVVTVGVGSYVDMKQLRGTAGFKKRLIEIPGGAETIGESKFKDRIINIICGETCERR